MASVTAAGASVLHSSSLGPSPARVRARATAAPAGRSSYALLVNTIDRERHAIIRTLYYRDLINNLSKTRRDAALVRVGASWRPGEITVESVRQATRTHLTLSWREVPDAADALFEPAGLERPSGLSWP